MSNEMSRREFLLMTAAAGVSVKLASLAPLRPGSALSKPTVPSGRFAYSPRVRKFVVGLPGLGPDGANEIGQYIPLATGSTRHFAGRVTDVYDLAVAEYRQTMHPDLPGPTRFWGYRDAAAGTGKYLGGVIVAHRDRPVLLNVTNRLPNRQLIPSDPTIMAGDGKMVGDLPYNRCVTHLHGGLHPVVQRRHAVSVVRPVGSGRGELLERAGNQHAGRFGELLLPDAAKRAATLVPRPRHGDHAHERLLGPRLGARPSRRFRARTREQGSAARPHRHAARHPGQVVRGRGHTQAGPVVALGRTGQPLVPARLRTQRLHTGPP